MGMGNTEGPMQRSDAVIAIVSMFIIAMMILTPTGLAVSVSYTATTTSSGNSISASYFTVGVYESDNFNENTPVKVENISNHYSTTNYAISSGVQAMFSKTNGTYSIDTSYMLTVNNCYLSITNSENTSGVNYNVSFSSVISGDVSSYSTFSFEYMLGNDSSYKSLNTASSMQSGKVYKFSLRLNIAYSCTTEPSDFGFNISVVTSTSASTGTLACQQTLNHDVVNVETGTLINDMMESNNGSLTISTLNGTYNISPTPDGVNYGTNTDAIRISNGANNDGGIASGNGRVYVDFNVPKNKQFCFAIRYDNTKTPQKLTMTIEDNWDVLWNRGDVTLDSSHSVKYVRYSSSDLSWGDEDPIHAIVTNSISSYQWFNSSTGKMRITLEASPGASNIQSDTTIDIVFKTS